jgi:hypothetical protein
MAFETGDPAIIEAPRGRGTVIQVATSADAGWTSWPVHNSYPPLMQRLVIQASTGPAADRNIKVGQPFDHYFSVLGISAPVTVVTPKGQSVNTKLQPTNTGSLLHFEQTDLSGRYQVQFGGTNAKSLSFSANTDPSESDLSKLDRQELSELGAGWNVLYLTNWRELTESAASVGRRGEFHRPFLYALFGLLLVESFLAWKFGHYGS